MKHPRILIYFLAGLLTLMPPSIGRAAIGSAETDDIAVDTRDAPSVTTPTNTSITGDSATLGGTVTSDGGATISKRGVVIAATATNANPLIGGTSVTKIVASGTTGIFTTSVTGLTPGTGYSFKAFATNAAGTSYTAVATFTTLAFPDIAVEDEVATNLISGSATKNMGSVLRGASGAALTFTVRNTGQAPLTGLALSKVGGNASDFVLGSLGSTSVPGGGNTTFTVTFSPSAVGPRSTVLHIASNDPDAAENPFVIALSGTGLNNPPTDITLSANSVTEGNSVNLEIGTLAAADPDAAQSFVYTLVSGAGSADNGSFSLSGSSLRIGVQADFEGQSSYQIRVRSTDGGGLFFEKDFVINVTDVPETTPVITIAGSTAFRAVINKAVIQLLGGPSKCKYAYTGTGGISGAEAAIFEGTTGPNSPFIVRTLLLGSGKGIADLISETSLADYLDPTATASDRIVGGKVIDPVGKTAFATPRFAFSDVEQSITRTPSPALTGQAVAVLPYVFVANPGAPVTLTNMTDQLFYLQWALGDLTLSSFTGVPGQNGRVVNVGPSSTSGMRGLIQAETKYGPFTLVVQRSGTDPVTGAEGTGSVTALGNLGDGGYASTAALRAVLARGTTAVNIDGEGAQNVTLIGYLPLSDAAALTDVTGGAGVGAVDLKYNGVAYSEGNLRNGAYTLWSYEQLYQAPSLSSEETSFGNAIVTKISEVLDPQTNGVRLSDMNVTRYGGDGGVVLP